MRIVFASLGVVGLLLVVLAAFLGHRKLRQFETWPRVPATISDLKLDFQRGVKDAFEERYALHATASYTLDGTPHTTKVDLDDDYPPLARLADALRGPGPHDIRVNPAKPDEVVLHASLDAGDFWVSYLLLGGAFLLLWVAAFGFWPMLALRALLYAMIVGFGVAGAITARRMSARKAWPTVAAEIDVVDVVYRHTQSNSGTSSTTLWQYAPLPWVSYDAAGARRATPVEPHTWYSGTTGESNARRRAAELEKQGTMELRYNPENVYEIAAPGEGRGYLAICVLVVLLGIAIEAGVRYLSHRYHFVSVGENKMKLRRRA